MMLSNRRWISCSRGGSLTVFWCTSCVGRLEPQPDFVAVMGAPSAPRCLPRLGRFKALRLVAPANCRLPKRKGSKAQGKEGGRQEKEDRRGGDEAEAKG